jgi:hypothetical protein
MQFLLITANLTTPSPIYLPPTKAAIPFGDPLPAYMSTASYSTGAVIWVPGYTPVAGDAVSFSYTLGTPNLLGTSVVLSTMFTFNTVFYVQPNSSVASQANQGFTLSSQKGTLSSVGSWVAGNAGNSFPIYATQTAFIHLLSNEMDGTTLPFKPDNTVMAWNLGASIGTGVQGSQSITLFGCADVSTTLATGTYGAPLGPVGTSAGTGWNVLATVAFGAPKLVQLSYDWICASGSINNLLLLQN